MKEHVEKTMARTQHLEQELQKKEAMIAHFERRVKSETARANDAAENANSLRNDRDRAWYLMIILTAIFCIVYSGAFADSTLDPGGNIGGFCTQRNMQGHAGINLSNPYTQHVNSRQAQNVSGVHGDTVLHRTQKSWDDGRKPTIPITDDERAISYESAGRHEVSSEEPSQHKEEGQNTQQQLGLLLAEISVLQQEHAADRELIEMLKAHSVERAQEMKQQSMRVAAFMQAAQSEYQDREKFESVNAQKNAQSEQLGHSDMHTGMPTAAGMKSKSTVMTFSSFKSGKNNRDAQRGNAAVSAKSNANARGSAAAGTCNHEIAGSYYRCLTGMTCKVAAEQRGDHGDTVARKMMLRNQHELNTLQHLTITM